MPRCRTYLSSSGTPVHTCCLRFCPRNSSSSSHHGNVSANDDIQEVHHVPVCIPLPSFAKAFFNFSFSRERRNQQQEPHLTPSQPASQPASPSAQHVPRSAVSVPRRKNRREGKGRGDDSHEKTAGHAPHGFAKPPRMLLCVRACVRVQCHYYYLFQVIIVFRQFAPRMEPVFLLQRRAPPRKKKAISA